MSRTYKDRPHHALVRDLSGRVNLRTYHHHESNGCDLAEWQAATDRTWRSRWRYHCYRELTNLNYHGLHHVPGWFVNHVWNGPERLRERVGLREATRAYNAGEDLDGYDFPNHQHRHCAVWLWD